MHKCLPTFSLKETLCIYSMPIEEYQILFLYYVLKIKNVPLYGNEAVRLTILAKVWQNFKLNLQRKIFL